MIQSLEDDTTYLGISLFTNIDTQKSEHQIEKTRKNLNFYFDNDFIIIIIINKTYTSQYTQFKKIIC